MSFIFRRQAFNPSCPSGGIWYACDSGSNFVGCCNSSPCKDGCPDGNIEPASFDPAYIGQFPDQECPAGSRWYTCAATSPPFMGCCKSNPCTDGCPVGDLTAGFLSSNPKIAAAFNPSGGSSSLTSSSPTSSSASAPSLSCVPAQSSSTSSSQAAPSGSSHTGAIAGGVVGGVAAIALLIALLVFYCKRKSAKSSEHVRESRMPPNKPPPKGADNNPKESLAQDQKQGILQGKLLSSLSMSFHSILNSPGSQTSTPAPMYPNSPALPAYHSSLAEMDSQPQTKPLQSPSQSFQQAFPPSGEYSSNGLGLSESPSSHQAHLGSYTSYPQANPPPGPSPLASPMVELDGTASNTPPFRYAIAAQRPSTDRHDSWELSSSNRVRAQERPEQSKSLQPRPAHPSSPSPVSSFSRPPPPAPPGGWVNC